jgi:asparagine synthetase B (glutamine-hydrolysing)
MHSIFASFTSLNDGAFHQSIPFVCDSDVFCLSSVAVGNTSTFEEVPCIGIYCIDLSGQQLQFFPYLPLQALTEIEPSSLVDKYGCLHSLTFCDEICQDDRVNGAADLLLQHLSNAVGNRVRTIPKRFLTDLSSPTSLTARVGVLFSGGLDSVVLGALTHFHLPPDESVDLLNVCFDADRNFKSPDRLAAEISWKELKKLFPTREWRFIRINIHFEEVLQYKNDIYDLMQPCDTHMDFNIGAAFWFLSRAIGVITPSTSSGNNLNANDLNAFLKTPQKRVEEEKLSSLKLFDGLKDTTTNDPTQNLCPVINCKRKKKGSCLFRICRVCCFRIQHYVNKLLNEQTDEREKESCKKNFKTMGLEESVDDVIAIFHLPDSSCDCKTHRTKESKEAASALQNSNAHSNSSSSNIDEQNVVEYATDARVLLVGIGADEQLAGYGRHRTAYLKGGKKALEEELAMDMNRIWKRNLGRDDRCISAHGREARFPYLDENVVKYLKSIPVETICDLDQERGDGDKLILRVAARRLGLYNCTVLAKRAIQFGSRIAKHSNVLSFGSNRQASGDAKFTLTTEKRF